jgi:hypothetical protein
MPIGKINIAKNIYTIPIIFGVPLLWLLLINPTVSFAQDNNDVFAQRVSLPRQRTSVYQALNQLSDSIGYLFAYDSKLIDSDRKVKPNIIDIPLLDALNQLLNDTTLTCKIIDKHILIYPKPFKPKSDSNNVLNDSISYYTLKGRVLDAQTLEPLAYATIGIPEIALGNITNIDGAFLLKVSKKIASKNVLVSHIGYQTKSVPLALLQFGSVDIHLNTDFISIQEVIIRNIDPKQLVRDALAKINKNYSQQPVYSNSFYREGVSKNGKYQNYSEAIFRIYTSAYSFSPERDQLKLIKSRKTQNLEPTDTLSIKLKGGVISSLSLDIIKNKPVFLDEENWGYYNFIKKDILTIGNRLAYAIGFEQNDVISEPLVNGVMYIDIENLAILGADFEVNPKHISKTVNQYIYKTNRKLRLKPSRINYTVRYANYNGVYHLSHVRGDLRFKYRFRRNFLSNSFHLFFELVTTQIDTKNVTRFNRKEVDPGNNVFFETNYSYDQSFWSNLNTIAPEQNIFESLKVIKAKIEEIHFE